MKIVVFLDLDDTIFQTEHKCPAGENVRPVAVRRDGTPICFMTPKQRTLLDWLFRTTVVIPTTARNHDAFRRVDLPFSQGAILNFGGSILGADHQLDSAWDAVVRPQAQTIAADLRNLGHTLTSWAAQLRLDAYTRLIADFDMPLYLVTKSKGGDGESLVPLYDRLGQILDPERFFLHRNDNNLSVVPRFLGKDRAVRHVLDQHFAGEPVLSIGIGDSLSDVPYLTQCDFSMTPRGSQLSRQLFSSLGEGPDV